MARDALREAPYNDDSICEPIRAALGVDDAGVATLARPFDLRMVCAAGDLAGPFGELQIDLGEGPSWDAFRAQGPVVSSSVPDPARWPILSDRMGAMRIGSVYAFPLSTPYLEVGALCLTSAARRELDRGQLQAALTLAPLAAAAVLARAMREDPPKDERPPATYSLREVHQATGMVSAQLRVSTDDALAAIRAHAFSTSRSVRDVAHDIVGRAIDLSRD
jgi:hypothetical protein